MPRSRAFLGGVAFASAIGLLLVLWWIPWLTQQRDVIVSSPSPPGLFGATTVAVKSPQELCWSNVPLDHRAQVLGVFPVTGGGAAPALHFRLAAPGYATTADVPASGYADRQLLRVPLRASPPDAVGTLCVRPDHGALEFVGTNEPRTRSRPDISVGGKPVDADVVLYFYRRAPASIGNRLGEIASHAQVVAAPFFGRWLLISLLVLVAAGVPIAVGFAIVHALRED
jgi:hypothetical protein